uniref:Intron-binding protein aquarius n=1 Tax=Rhodosorus marinus TaxID=101924 RepID=A0A7S2ZWQ1_9RHOD|mmetsp:Transcript_35741/g.142931  ORF Transcript_35741/g.142931 Transcript_35741/m.142931 type:complete len:1358 (+) Transcript_35741:225-4298(+)
MVQKRAAKRARKSSEPKPDRAGRTGKTGKAGSEKAGSVGGGVWNPGMEEFSEGIVQSTYANIEQNLQSLELGQYLETFLFPNISEDHHSKAHVMSAAMIVVEKHNQGLEPFAFVHDELEKFTILFSAVAELENLNIPEKRTRIGFFNVAFNSLEVPIVRRTCLPYVHLPLWMNLSDERLKEELSNSPRRIRKQFDKLRNKQNASRGEQSLMIPRLLMDFVGTLEKSKDVEKASTGLGEKVAYLERFADLMIDLLSQLPTRRFFRPLVDDLQVVVKCRLAIAASKDPEAFSVLSKLLDLVDFYVEFEINDHTGDALSVESVVQRQCERLAFLQRTAFRTYPKVLEDLALTNQSSIEDRASLKEHLSKLDDKQLMEFAAAIQCVPKGETVSRLFAEEAILHRYCRRRTQAESFKREPLYPTEDLIWNTSIVPPSDFSFASKSLALPKLNLQFLTMYDYLLRNYTLYRLESTSEIRDDLESVIKRMRPRLADQGNLVFDGWARMAATIKDIKILEKKPPRLDHPSPRSVLCELTYDLRKLPLEARREWDEAKEHDVFFLVGIDIPETAFENGDDSKIGFAQANGVRHVRGICVSAMLDADGNEVREWEVGKAVYGRGDSPIRRLRAYLDPVQYFLDEEKGLSEKLYRSKGEGFNLLIRRKAKENNFKAILETIRNLISTSDAGTVIPAWLHDNFLGYGNPGGATYYSLAEEDGNERAGTLDFYDTFLSEEHLKRSFPHMDVQVTGGDMKDDAETHFKATFEEDSKLRVEAYDSSPMYRVGEKPKRNPVPFTPTQVGAIRSGMEKGLTLIVGPPGTGKTDVAVQILANLYRSYPDQKVLVVTHSNYALNDIFEKIMQRDVDERHLLRLGQGEKALATEKSFSKVGRVNHMLQKRLDRLSEVAALAKSLNVAGDHGYTCETADLFFKHTVRLRWEKFLDSIKREKDKGVQELFPFGQFFPDAPFSQDESARELNVKIASDCYDYILGVFKEVEECRAMELLRNNKDRGDYLLCKQARIIAMTCTHAAMRRDEFIRLGLRLENNPMEALLVDACKPWSYSNEFEWACHNVLRYDSLVMEEAGQVLEIETLIPMLLQKPDNPSSGSPLKRVVLVGDHNQLPPIVKNPALQKYARMSQSLFSRLIRLGNPAICLDKQGRARPELADLYRWRYDKLEDLGMLADGSAAAYKLGNPGFVHDFQLIDVGNLDTESAPVPFFYQNIVEAEYIAALYQYMRLLGYQAEKITVLTTYNGQKHLLKDVISARIQWNPSIGMPSKISTVDKYQGRQNDYVLLSLVRTRNVGHIRDVRRLVVALSRARLGLYMFCRKELFESCLELAPAFKLLSARFEDSTRRIPRFTISASHR